MNKEEKKAIEILQHYLEMEEFDSAGDFLISIDKVLNLIDKQQKEIESNKQMIEELNFRYNIEHSKNFLNKELIDKQQKEIEELKEIKWKVVEIIADKNDNLEEMFIKLIKLFKIPKENVETVCISKDKIMEIAKEYIEDETIDLHGFYIKVMKLLGD